MGEKRTYSEETRAEALGLYVSVGLSAAARALDIPSGTIASWANRTEGVQTLASENRSRMAAALEASSLRWQQRKLGLVDQFGGLADTMLAVAFDAAEEGDTNGAKNAVTSAAIAADKAQLLSGGATSRVEVTDDDRLAAEVERLVEERRSMVAGAIQVDSRGAA